MRKYCGVYQILRCLSKNRLYTNMLKIHLFSIFQNKTFFTIIIVSQHHHHCRHHHHRRHKHNHYIIHCKKTNLTCNSTAFNVTYVSSAARGALVWWRHISTVLKNEGMHIEKIMLQKSFAHLTYAGNVRSSLSCNKRTHVVFKSLIDYLN